MSRRRWTPGERLGGRPATADWVHDDPDAPRVGVLALQGDVLEHLRALRRVGAAPSQVRTVEQLDEVDALVLPGGESTTIGKLLEITGLMGPLRERVAAGTPVFGTCAGMILLADELAQDREQPLVGGLGCRVERNAYGRQVDSFDTTVTVDGLEGPPLDVSFIRAPRVAAVLADDVQVLGAVDGDPVVVRRGHLLAAAFHPEVTGDDRLHAHFVGMVRQQVASA